MYFQVQTNYRRQPEPRQLLIPLSLLAVASHNQGQPLTINLIRFRPVWVIVPTPPKGGVSCVSREMTKTGSTGCRNIVQCHQLLVDTAEPYKHTNIGIMSRRPAFFSPHTRTCIDICWSVCVRVEHMCCERTMEQ